MENKLGRNPFIGKKVNRRKVNTTPTTPLESEPKETASETRKNKAQPLWRQAISTKMRRFSIFRYDHSEGGRKIELLSLGLINPIWSHGHHFEVPLLKRGPLQLSLFSLKIKSV